MYDCLLTCVSPMLQHLKCQTYTHEVTGSSSVTNDSPPLVSTTKVDDTERVKRYVIFDFDNRTEEFSTISSHISTEMFDNNEALCLMDAEFLSSNLNTLSDIIVPQNIYSTTVQQNETGISNVHFGQCELEIAKEYYNTKLIAVDHDKKVKDEMSSIFETPRYKSHKARAILVNAAKYPLPEVMLTIYTTYHSPLSCLLFSYLEHDNLKTMIDTFHSMKPLMNCSFPLRIPELSLFPTMSLRCRFRILVQAIQETPEHRPDASRFWDLIWMSTCEYCACEITSGYFDMSLGFFGDYAPSVSNNTFVNIRSNEGARLFRRQHFHGAQNRINLSTDHTMQVSR
jgi:hypothetical protein